jgi:hypothetical protein
MRPRSLLLFSSLILMLAACAKAASTGGEGGDGSGPGGGVTTAGNTTAGNTSSGTSSTGSDTTSTGSDTTSTSSTTTSTGSSATSTGSGPVCAESPCKLTLPQCGCAGGEQCTVGASGRSCIPVGNVGNGQVCAGPECSPGLLCLQITPAVSTCGKFCATDADCTAPGGLCILKLNDGNGGSIPNVVMCTENCDPTTGVGCPVAGTSCQLAQEPMGQMRFLTHCIGAGAGVQGVSCTTSADCASKFSCLNIDPNNPTAGTCLKYCKASNPNGCPAGTTCKFFSTPATVGAEEYGVCL